MAIVINTAPGSFYSAQGDLIFVVYEATKANDPTTYPDYKYVADIYIGAVQVARIKKVPQPDNKRGIFNIGDVIRNYVSANFNPTAATLQAQQLGLANFFINATVKFGEEYGFTTYTNLTVDDERIYYNHYNGRLIGQNTILPDFIDLIASTRPYSTPVLLSNKNNFISYLPSDSTPVPVAVTSNNGTYSTSITPTDQFLGPPVHADFNLTEATTPDFIDGNGQLKINGAIVLNITATSTDTYEMPEGSAYSFEAFVLLASSATNPKIRLTISNLTGVIYDNQIPSVISASMTKTGIVQPGQGPYTFSIVTEDTTTPVTPIDIPDDDPVPSIIPLQILNVSPFVLNALSPGLITSGSFTVKVGDTSIYNFVAGCEPKYEVFNLHFLNKFGGFESREFTKVSRKSLAITKTDFGRLPYTIDASGNVNYYNSNGVYNETRSTYASQFTEKLTLNTDVLTDAEYVWLAELILSPLIYIEQGAFFIPIAIAANNYNFNKVIVDKITNLTIDVAYGEVSNAQYR